MCGDLGWVGTGELGESSAVRAQQGLQVQPCLGPENSSISRRVKGPGTQEMLHE